MITPGARLFFGFSAIGLVATIVYGLSTGEATSGQYLGVVDAEAWRGVISLGWSGGIGDHVGYLTLLGFTVVSGFIGAILVAFRDADAEAVAQLTPTGEIPPAQAPTQPNYWPAAAAAGVGVLVIGLVAHEAYVILGLVILAVVTAEWAVSAWADRATGDPAANKIIRNRFMQPIEVPIIAAGGGVIMVLATSRVLLAVTEFSAIWVATAVAVIIMVLAIVFLALPKASPSVVAGVLVLLAIGVIAGGIITAAIGQRDIEEHEEHHPEETDETGDIDEGGAEALTSGGSDHG
jgi:hypothetical protein